MPVTAMRLRGDAVRLDFATAQSLIPIPISSKAAELEFSWGASFEGRLDATGRLEGGLTRQIRVNDSGRYHVSRARFALEMEPGAIKGAIKLAIRHVNRLKRYYFDDAVG